MALPRDGAKGSAVKGDGGRKEIVTLVGVGQSTPGARFIASKPPEVCTSCKLFAACMAKLIPGRAYEVTMIRDKEHFCPLYEGMVKVAKVIEAPVDVLVKPQHAMEGAIITIEIEKCEKRCPLEKECMPEWAAGSQKARVKVISLSEDVSDLAVCGKKFRKAKALIVGP
ncbi:MAG: UPF0179 family protein [Candidatus Methanomethylicia archaeon]|nr:UPF0179 family protein [Candidatus Methanomethylicia archaeon]